MLYRKINQTTGLFIEDVMTDTPTDDLIATPVPDGFYWPKWEGKQWIEGRTAAEIAPIIAAKVEAQKIVDNETDIRTKLKVQIATLQTDLGSSTDAAGSTTINAILNQTNAQINASAATYIKALARIMKTNQKADIRDIRLMIRELSAPDTDA